MQFHIQIHTFLKQSKFLFSHGISHTISHKKPCEILASQQKHHLSHAFHIPFHTQFNIISQYISDHHIASQTMWKFE